MASFWLPYNDLVAKVTLMIEPMQARKWSKFFGLIWDFRGVGAVRYYTAARTAESSWKGWYWGNGWIFRKYQKGLGVRGRLEIFQKISRFRKTGPPWIRQTRVGLRYVVFEAAYLKELISLYSSLHLFPVIRKQLGKASEKKYGIIWEFFPNVGPIPPPLTLLLEISTFFT